MACNCSMVEQCKKSLDETSNHEFPEENIFLEKNFPPWFFNYYKAIEVWNGEIIHFQTIKKNDKKSQTMKMMSRIASRIAKATYRGHHLVL